MLKDWPEEEDNKENGSVENENGEQPVWVLRDSYTKRIARDQQRATEWAEASTVAGAGITVDEGGNEGVEEEEETDRLLAVGAETEGRSREGTGPKKATKES